MDDIASWLAVRHNVPLILLGDFNVNVEHYAPTAHWLASGLMTDVVAQHECPKHSTHSSGSTLDHGLATPAFMRMCVGASTDQSFVFPSHRGIRVHIAIHSYAYTSYLNVPPLPVTRLARLRLSQMLEARDTPQHYKDALALGDVDSAYSIWSERWESLLIAACQIHRCYC